MAALAVAALATPVRARAQGADCLVIETFADSQIGQFPLGWKALKDAGKVSYTVQEEAGLRFLRALVTGLGIQDAAVATFVAERAAREGLGRTIEA